MSGRGPTVQRRALGAELRRLREKAGLKVEDAASRLECSQSKISRIETAQGALVKTRDLRDLLTLYGVVDTDQVGQLLKLRAAASERGWWESYDRLLPSGISQYVGLESDARCVDTYEPLVVCGLLQTRDYAEAILSIDRSDPQEIEQLVAFRMERQRLLTRSRDPLELWVIQEEASLRRPLGDAALMRDQLRRITEVSELPNVTVQVMPQRKGRHIGVDGPFLLLGFDERTQTPPGVFVDTQVGNLMVQKDTDVQRFSRRLNQLRALADAPEETPATLERIAKELA